MEEQDSSVEKKSKQSGGAPWAVGVSGKESDQEECIYHQTYHKKMLVKSISNIGRIIDVIIEQKNLLSALHKLRHCSMNKAMSLGES